MQGDAGVALFARALPVNTHTPGVHDVFRAKDGPGFQNDSRFESLLSDMLFRAPDALSMRGMQRSWEFVPEPFSEFKPTHSGPVSVGSDRNDSFGLIGNHSGNEAPPPFVPHETTHHEPHTTAGTSAERMSAVSHEDEGPEDEALLCTEVRNEGAERTRVRDHGVHVQGQADEAQKKEEGDLLRLVQQVREGLDTVRKGVREIVQDGLTEEKQAKLADDLQGLLDLLSSFMPKEKLEGLSEQVSLVFDGLNAARANASKKGMQGQQGAVQDRGILSLVQMVKLLPENQEVTAFAEEAKKLLAAMPGKGQELKKGRSLGEELAQGGVRSEQRDAREVFRLAVEVRDQRMNDPRSLRDAVRVTHREALNQQARPASAGELAAEVKPALAAADSKVFMPVSESKPSQQTSPFMQSSFGATEAGASKKVFAGETLRNPQQIIQQIVEHARVTIKSGMSEMHLTLNPRNMGRIGMHFSVGADGEIFARLSASNDAVRQYLQENLSNFSRDLADAGVSVAHLEVSDNGTRRQFMDGRAPDEGKADEGSANTAAAKQAAEQAAVQQHDGLLDVQA
jgi:hypothetical protein